MATPAQFITALDTKLVATITAGTPARATQDYRTDLGWILDNDTIFQIRSVAAQVLEEGSNEDDEYTHVAFNVFVYHKVTTVAAIKTYTDGAMQSDIALLVDPDLLRDMAEVFELVDPMELDSDDIEVIGHTIVYSVSARVRLTQ